MNIDSIINMITRIFLRKIVNGGINKGMQMASRHGKGQGNHGPDQSQDARELAKRARKAARITRRLGR